MKKRIFAKLFSVALVMALFACELPVNAETIPVYHGIPAYQQKDIFETETITVKGITVNEVVNANITPIETKPIESEVNFIIFNVTIVDAAHFRIVIFRTAADGGNAIGNGQLFQLDTAAESKLPNLPQAIRQADLGQRGAEVKSTHTH